MQQIVLSVLPKEVSCEVEGGEKNDSQRNEDVEVFQDDSSSDLESVSDDQPPEVMQTQEI
jgi:hypothetical protein